MRFFFFVFSVFCLFTTSCTRYFYYQPTLDQQEEKAQVIHHQGIPSVRLSENSIDLSTGLTTRGQYDMNVGIAIRNESDSIFNFMPESVRVFGFDISGRKTPFRVFSAEQFIRYRNTRNAIIVGAVVVATVATAVAINSSNKDNDFDSNNNVWRGDEFFWALSAFPNVVVVPNSAAGPAFNTPSDGLLRSHTLMPGEELRGVVKVRARAGFTNKILVQVPIDGQYRSFTFDNPKRRF